MKYTDIKTFEDALKALNLVGLAIPDFSMLPKKHEKAMLAHFKLVLIAEALNGGWQPNWNDSNEYKYAPWPWVNADDEHTSGTGLSCDYCGLWVSLTCVGSRLCYQSRDIAKYAFEQFKDLYEDYFLIKD